MSPVAQKHAQRKDVLAGLLDVPNARQDEGDRGEAVVSFVKEGNARGALPTTLVGRAIVDQGAHRLETNSRERAGRLRGLVEKRLGPLMTSRIREHADPVAQLGGANGVGLPALAGRAHSSRGARGNTSDAGRALPALAR